MDCPPFPAMGDAATFLEASDTILTAHRACQKNNRLWRELVRYSHATIILA
jgi:hypothetical protein